MVWEMNGKKKMIVNIKEKEKIRKKKRWRKVM